ncbi:hypothetical protein B9Z55_017560 [Caenorhabditis nigoni]|uniref:UPAR/Ly6 domain-containing protein n=1 Tax=Caenorhabditis nigoni TaxID=1611254 RepID=A0A2G5T9M6_9PELO|nr:hypothetical protein B9Z55_017560 [Caenorhabditis nigoni]
MNSSAHFLLFLTFFIFKIDGGRNECYSCSGVCHNEPCNCQMGSCESGQCFIEKKPTEIPGSMKITKGCLRRTSRIHHGCEYDHFSDHILCVCQGHYCNDKVVMNTTRQKYTRTVTCRECSEKQPDCGSTCEGHWCHEDMSTGASGCGYGPPALPFYYRGPELFYYRSKVCITLSRGAGKPRRHCVCSTNMCNTVYNYQFNQYNIKDREKEGSTRARSLTLSATDYTLPLQTCYNCETNTQDATSMSHTTNCRSNRCLGHYCTYAAQRHTSKSSMGRSNMVHAVSELQGCMNVSDKSHIQLGCSKKWISDEYEEIHCACKGSLCNSDSLTATASQSTVPLLLIFLFSIYFL